MTESFQVRSLAAVAVPVHSSQTGGNYTQFLRRKIKRKFSKMSPAFCIKAVSSKYKLGNEDSVVRGNEARIEVLSAEF